MQANWPRWAFDSSPVIYRRGTKHPLTSEVLRPVGEKAQSTSRRVEYSKAWQILNSRDRIWKSQITNQRPEPILSDSEILTEAAAPEAGNVPLRTALQTIDKSVAIRFVEIDVVLE